MESTHATLASLTRQVRALEREPGRARPACLATGWPGLDGLLPGGGLARGAVHEWLGLEGAGSERATRSSEWTPALFLLAHLARRAFEAPGADCAAAEGEERWVLWIGRRVWPYPRTLTRGGGLMERVGLEPRSQLAPAQLEGAQFSLELADAARGQSDRALLDHSLFIDPPDRKGLLWAVDAALRCPSVVAVVADGSGLPMPASRRLQLAAESGAGLCFLARPATELRQITADSTARARKTIAHGANALRCTVEPGAAAMWRATHMMKEMPKPR